MRLGWGACGCCQVTRLVSVRLGAGFEREISSYEAFPLRQCGKMALLECLAINEAAFEIDLVSDVTVDGCEILEGLHSPTPKHRARSSRERLMVIFHSVVIPASHVTEIENCRHRALQHGKKIGRAHV